MEDDKSYFEEPLDFYGSNDYLCGMMVRFEELI